MPPLCTAGYGIASGQIYYFMGAFYLFLINSVFISLATYLVVRLLKYPKKVFLDENQEKRVSRYVGVIVLFTLVPSLFLSYNLIRSSYFRDRANKFIAAELHFPQQPVIKSNRYRYKDKKEIRVILIGDNVPDNMIQNARNKLPQYGLKGTELVVQQGFGQDNPDINELRTLLMQDFIRIVKKYCTFRLYRLTLYVGIWRCTRLSINWPWVDTGNESIISDHWRSLLFPYLHCTHGKSGHGYSYAGLSEK